MNCECRCFQVDISSELESIVSSSQDTNTMQYQLMRVLADACGGCVSVVGDPDQSSTYILYTP